MDWRAMEWNRLCWKCNPNVCSYYFLGFHYHRYSWRHRYGVCRIDRRDLLGASDHRRIGFHNCKVRQLDIFNIVCFSCSRHNRLGTIFGLSTHWAGMLGSGTWLERSASPYVGHLDLLRRRHGQITRAAVPLSGVGGGSWLEVSVNGLNVWIGR